MKWKTRVIGSEHVLRELERSLTDSFFVTKGKDGFFYLEYEQFSECQTVEEVFQISSKILTIINGATRLAFGRDSIVAAADILQEKDDGTPKFYLHVSDTMTIRDSDELEILDSEAHANDDIYSANEVLVWAQLGMKDDAVEKVFQLLGIPNRHNWVDLYRIYEIIEDDAGGMDVIASNDWAAKSSLKLFKRTANSPGAVGSDARHGKERNTPPQKPMLLDDAQALMESLTLNWLRAKHFA